MRDLVDLHPDATVPAMEHGNERFSQMAKSRQGLPAFTDMHYKAIVPKLECGDDKIGAALHPDLTNQRSLSPGS